MLENFPSHQVEPKFSSIQEFVSNIPCCHFLPTGLVHNLNSDINLLLYLNEYDSKNCKSKRSQVIAPWMASGPAHLITLSIQRLLNRNSRHVYCSLLRFSIDVYNNKKEFYESSETNQIFFQNQRVITFRVSGYSNNDKSHRSIKFG